ncbi:hypothetical protein KSS87_010129 [Heliosperma pusillum]|nr:hypothetical protein KSS87_010129 [Heliosperma pusillum]
MGGGGGGGGGGVLVWVVLTGEELGSGDVGSTVECVVGEVGLMGVTGELGKVVSARFNVKKVIGDGFVTEGDVFESVFDLEDMASRWVGIKGGMDLPSIVRCLGIKDERSNGELECRGQGALYQLILSIPDAIGGVGDGFGCWVGCRGRWGGSRWWYGFGAIEEIEKAVAFKKTGYLEAPSTAGCWHNGKFNASSYGHFIQNVMFVKKMSESLDRKNLVSWNVMIAVLCMSTIPWLRKPLIFMLKWKLMD